MALLSKHLQRVFIRRFVIRAQLTVSSFQLFQLLEVTHHSCSCVERSGLFEVDLRLLERGYLACWLRDVLF
jgi:hypothetical protein